MKFFSPLPLPSLQKKRPGDEAKALRKVDYVLKVQSTAGPTFSFTHAHCIIAIAMCSSVTKGAIMDPQPLLSIYYMILIYGLGVTVIDDMIEG